MAIHSELRGAHLKIATEDDAILCLTCVASLFRAYFLGFEKSEREHILGRDFMVLLGETLHSPFQTAYFSWLIV